MKCRQLLQILCWTGMGLGVVEGYGQGQRLGAPAEDGKAPGGAPSVQGIGGIYSPNLYTGTASINIPIYEYSVENNSFGVSFGYDTKGVTVNELASDIGLHWSLNAGASISRVQKDLPDEISLTDGNTDIFMTPGAPPSQPFPGYVHPPYDTISINSFWAFKGRYATFFESTTSAADVNIYRDKEADDFVVTLGGGTFTFNLCKNNAVFTHPKRSVSVEVLWDDQPLGSISDLQVIGGGSNQNLLGFRIRDEQGNTYTFKRSEYVRTTIYDTYGKSYTLSQYQSTSKWVVSHVKLATGAEITYTYQPVEYVMHTLPPGKTYSVAEGNYASSCVDTPVYSEYTYTSKLESITYPNGTFVSFLYDSQTRPDYPYGALQKIRVAGGGTSCLNYVLQQSFFNSDPAAPEKTYAQGLATPVNVHYNRHLRLKLNGIQLVSCDNSVQEPFYSFTYDGTVLPPRLSPQQDYFGYFNGNTSEPYVNSAPCNFQTSIPYHNRWLVQAGYEYGMYKTPVFANMKAAILRSVTNAYGGTAQFHYGAHSGIDTGLLTVPSDDLYFARKIEDNDGLRLDSIVESERFHSDNKKVTVFQYSGGQRFFHGGYFHYTSRFNGTDSTATSPQTIIMTSNFLTPHQMVSGSNHGYSNVNIITRTGEGYLLSRKEIKFSNFKDPDKPLKYVKTGSRLDFYTYPFTDKQYLMDWAMGVPLEIKEYDQNNRLVLQTINKYTFSLDTTSAIGKVDNQRVALVPVSAWVLPGVSHTQNNKSIRDFYRPFTGAALLDTTIVRKYLSDVVFQADTVRYRYDSRNNLEFIYARNSKGQLIYTQQAYNYSYSSPLGSTLLSMTQAGIEKMVGIERWIIGTGGLITNRLLDASFNTFNYQDGKLSPKHLYNLQVSAPLTNTEYTGYTGGTNIPEPFTRLSSAFSGSAINYFVKTSEVTQADSKCNPQETKVMEQELYKAMIWNEETGRKLAEASSCRYSDIAYSSFEHNQTGNWNYNPLGVHFVTTSPTGRKSYSLASGGVSRGNLTADKAYAISFWATGLPTCTIGSSNVPLTAVAVKGTWTCYQGRFTPGSSGLTLSISGASAVYLDEMRLHPVTATMVSQTYTPLFGVGSSTDATGRITYYEYDALGRQSVVRDQDGHILSRTKYVVGGAE